MTCVTATAKCAILFRRKHKNNSYLTCKGSKWELHHPQPYLIKQLWQVFCLLQLHEKKHHFTNALEILRQKYNSYNHVNIFLPAWNEIKTSKSTQLCLYVRIKANNLERKSILLDFVNTSTWCIHSLLSSTPCIGQIKTYFCAVWNCSTVY